LTGREQEIITVSNENWSEDGETHASLETGALNGWTERLGADDR
jgi:hypothetical protein